MIMGIMFSRIRVFQFIVLVLLVFPIGDLSAQIARIKCERTFRGDDYEKFDSIQFYFNNVYISPFDTVFKVVPLKGKLDNCKAIIGRDTLDFFASFVSNCDYVIKPGCCCTAFTIEALQKPKRGTIVFNNKTEKDIGLIVCEHNSQVVKPKQTANIFASESAMCLFKPCTILLADSTYFSDEFEYKNDDRNYFQLWAKRKQLVIAELNFLFLHGEKMELEFDAKRKKATLKLLGYLTGNEYQRLLDGLE